MAASGRHVECADCHNVHMARENTYYMPSGNKPSQARGSIPPTISGANYGVWGVTMSNASSDGTLPLMSVGSADPDEAKERLLTVVHERIPRRFGLDPIRDVQVLAPMHRGTVGARSLNLALQERLSPPVPGRQRVERFGWSFGVGDKVLVEIMAAVLEDVEGFPGKLKIHKRTVKLIEINVVRLQSFE